MIAIAAALEHAGIDSVELPARAAGPEAKERLRRNTDEAVARGAFRSRRSRAGRTLGSTARRRQPMMRG
jgi:hypothetical protein